jgi:VanZ family protein
MSRKHMKWILVLIWACIIFMFSQQNGETSNNNNRLVIYILNALGLNLDKLFGTWSDFIIRKAAHFTEYFIFYFLIYNALIEDFSKDKSLIYALIGAFIYAFLDELHQAFVPGRSPAFRDVLIDTSGSALCMALVYLVSHRKKY